MQLRKLQQSWRAYIIEGKQETLIPMISGVYANAKQGLEIYGETYEDRLLEPLEETFACLQKTLGNKKFAEYGRDYLMKYPSHHYSLLKIGQRFSEYLNNAFVYDHFYTELASFEWALHYARNVKNAQCIQAEILQAVSPETWPYIIFEMHPSLQILAFHHNIIDFYENRQKTLNKPDRKNFNKQNKYYCRVWRKGTQVFYQAIDQAAYIFIKYIQEKLLFSQICEKLGEIMPEEKTAQYAVIQIRQWLSEELITGIKIDQCL